MNQLKNNNTNNLLPLKLRLKIFYILYIRPYVPQHPRHWPGRLIQYKNDIIFLFKPLDNDDERITGHKKDRGKQEKKSLFQIIRSKSLAEHKKIWMDAFADFEEIRNAELGRYELIKGKPKLQATQQALIPTMKPQTMPTAISNLSQPLHQNLQSNSNQNNQSIPTTTAIASATAPLVDQPNDSKITQKSALDLEKLLSSAASQQEREEKILAFRNLVEGFGNPDQLQDSSKKAFGIFRGFIESLKVMLTQFLEGYKEGKAEELAKAEQEKQMFSKKE